MIPNEALEGVETNCPGRPGIPDVRGHESMPSGTSTNT